MRAKIWQRLGLAILPLGIPLATLWVRHRERAAYTKGRPLSSAEFEDARAVGVQTPESVRILTVPRIVLFESRFLAHLTGFMPDVFGPTIGLTAGYGILLKEGWQNERRLLVHELTHVAQYERLGGVSPFLLRYFRECIKDGYLNSELEQEASSTTRKICG